MDLKVSTKDEKNHQILKKSWYMLYLWNKDDEAKLKQSKKKRLTQQEFMNRLMCALFEVKNSRLPTKVSFKGGSPASCINPEIPNPSFFLASPNLGTRFLLRVVVCNNPSFSNFWKIRKIKNFLKIINILFWKSKIMHACIILLLDCIYFSKRWNSISTLNPI